MNSQRNTKYCENLINFYQIKRSDVEVLSVFKEERIDGSSWDIFLNVKCNCCGEIKHKWDSSSFNKGRFFCKERRKLHSSKCGKITSSKMSYEQKRNLTAKYGILSTNKPNPVENLKKSGSTSAKLTNQKILVKQLNKIGIFNFTKDPENELISLLTEKLISKYNINKNSISFLTISMNPIININGVVKRYNDFMKSGLLKRISSLEQQFVAYANLNKTSFKQQFDISTKIKNPNTGHIMPIDFVVGDVHIEMDGQIHFFEYKITKLTSQEKASNLIENFHKRLALDDIKNNEALCMGLKLIRFPYFMGHSKMNDLISYIKDYNGTVSSFISVPYKIPKEIEHKYYEKNNQNNKK